MVISIFVNNFTYPCQLSDLKIGVIFAILRLSVNTPVDIERLNMY